MKRLVLLCLLLASCKRVPTLEDLKTECLRDGGVVSRTCRVKPSVKYVTPGENESNKDYVMFERNVLLCNYKCTIPAESPK